MTTNDKGQMSFKLIHWLTINPNVTIITTGLSQVLVFELKDEQSELNNLNGDQVTVVSDQRFTWKGHEKLCVRPGSQKQEPGYQLSCYVQLDPPVAATALDLCSEWRLFALGTSYGFILYDYANKHSVINRCTLNVQDFAIVSGDLTGPISRKKSFRKSLRESFRRLRRGRSQRGLINQPPASSGRVVTTGVRTLTSPSSPSSQINFNTNSISIDDAMGRNVFSTERQVEQKVELSSIIRCIKLTSAIITNQSSFKPTLWVGTNSGQVLVYAIELATSNETSTLENSSQSPNSTSSTNQSSPSEQQQQQQSDDSIVTKTTARLAKEIQLKHRAPIIAIFTSPEAPIETNKDLQQIQKLPIEKRASELLNQSDNKSSEDSTPERKNLASDKTNSISNEQQQNDSNDRAQSPVSPSKESSSSTAANNKKDTLQARVLICSEEQFKVFNLPNLKPFCKFKLTAHEGLRAKKISITQFLRPISQSSRTAISSSIQNQQSSNLNTKSLHSLATQTSPPASPIPPPENGSNEQSDDNNKQLENNNNSLSTHNNNNNTANSCKSLLNAKFGASANNINNKTNNNLTTEQSDSNELQFEPYMICMSNQGDCAIYSVPDLKRQAQIQVCKREDVIGIMSTMLTNYGEGYYLSSSSNFLRFSISSQRVLRVLSVV